MRASTCSLREVSLTVASLSSLFACSKQDTTFLSSLLCLTLSVSRSSTALPRRRTFSSSSSLSEVAALSWPLRPATSSSLSRSFSASERTSACSLLWLSSREEILLWSFCRASFFSRHSWNESDAWS